MADSVIQLKCDCNNYPWGRVGKQSLAATLCAKTNPEFKLDDSKNYAEMWMGTYPELPSYSLKTGEDLQQILNKNKEKLIGQTVLDKYGADLPFLPKILSIQKALPLQIHPDIELSKKLHKEDPEQFSDDNHKPEIAVALGYFEAFVGFKTLSDVEGLLKLEPLKQYIPKNAQNGKLDDEGLRELCRNLLSAEQDTVKSTIKSLKNIPKDSYGSQSYILDLIPRLEEQYGTEDNGNLVTLVAMNFLTLEAGSAIYIPADGIHAYLSGNIVECMARSNNVLNTGFCPPADRNSVDMFCKALTFKQHDPKEPMIKRLKTDKSKTGKTTEFAPPMSEFNMLVTELSKGDEETVNAVKGPSIQFVTSGSGKMSVESKEYDLPEGAIHFIGQGVDVKITASADLAVYRAYAE